MNNLSVISFLDKLKLICLHTSIAIVSTVKWFHLLHLTLIIQVIINHLFTHCEVVTSTAILH